MIEEIMETYGVSSEEAEEIAQEIKDDQRADREYENNLI